MSRVLFGVVFSVVFALAFANRKPSSIYATHLHAAELAAEGR